MQLCFASHNKNKIAELRRLLGPEFELLGLEDLGITEEIPEPGSTLEENALLKARYVTSRYDIPTFADDTGLEVEALDGKPGVYSARYAGVPANDDKNVEKLLKELKGVTNRAARFKTVIAFVNGLDQDFFVGEVEGVIAQARSGLEGFGYDPVFLPNGFDRTFAEMTMAEKNAISHRGRAVRKFIDSLSNLK